MDDTPKLSRDAPMTSDSDIDRDESPLYAMSQIGDNLPSSFLLWGEECIPNDDTIEASTSGDNEPNESNFKDRQHQNLALLIEREGITHNNNGASTSILPKPYWYKHLNRSSEIDSNEYEWIPC